MLVLIVVDAIHLDVTHLLTQQVNLGYSEVILQLLSKWSVWQYNS
jgi:hypothetical protein